MNTLISFRTNNKWENQKIKKKFKNRSCGSRARKVMKGYAKQIPQNMLRGWIRGKANRGGKRTKDLNRSHTDLKKIQYISVRKYNDIATNDYFDEDNWINKWEMESVQNNKTFTIKKRNKSIKQSALFYNPYIPQPPIQPLPIPKEIEQYTPEPAPIHAITAPIDVVTATIPLGPAPIAPMPDPSQKIPKKPKTPTKPKNTLVEDIKEEKDPKEEKEYALLGDKYISAMSEIESYGTYSSIEGLVDRSVFSSHKNDAADPTSDNFKKIMKEIKKALPVNQYQSINGSMFIRFDENNPRFLQILLTGIDDTPYANGMFLFDIYLCNDYPQKPLEIKHITKGATKCHANNGPGGFSPNLHQSSGKVCLSLLGTWSGPGWTPGDSNVYQVISTILFMIFGAKHPYYMEPGHGGWEGTIDGRTKHERRVIDYDEEVMYHNAKYAILDTIKSPYIGFEDVIKTHFKIKGKHIIKTINKWIKNENYTESFRNKIKPIFEQIKEELNKL